jgi:predicted metalloprotease with PDZ domain
VALLMAAVVAAGGAAWSYAVTAGPGARELRVEATFSRAVGDAFTFDDGLGPFVDEVEMARGRSWSKAETRGDLVLASACEKGPCRLRYRVQLERAARTLDDRGIAVAYGDLLLAPPSSWLARPLRDRGKGRYRFAVTLPPGISFATGVTPVAGAAETYEAGTDDLWQAPYSAFGPMEHEQVRAKGGIVEVALGAGEWALPREEVVLWARRSADAVAGYYGVFPVPRVQVIVVPGGRRPVGFGTTLGNGGASIVVWVGRGATREAFERDWVLAHEMTHLGFPNVPRASHWMEEGLATYVEPIARARTGLLPVADAWKGLAQGLPNGLPRAGEAGFDGNRRWGTLYWGGALFWFLADLEIRERTGGRRSVEDAIRAIRDAGGTIAVRWPVERMLATGDRATGTDVLSSLYARFGRAAARYEQSDLDALWKALGVAVEAGGVRFDDEAPRAADRRAITQPETAVPRGTR